MAASVNVITAVLTLTLSACLASTSNDTQIMPPYQLAFVNQSALFTFGANYSGHWLPYVSSGGSDQLKCSCVEINPVNDDNNTYQLYFNSTTASDAKRYTFFATGAVFVDPQPQATLSLLDVEVKTNVSDGGLAERDNVLVTCTLLFYNGYDKSQEAFSALINITANDREPKSVGLNSTTSSGNVSFEFILPASNQYNCSASFFDDRVVNGTAVLRTKTVTAERYQPWCGKVTDVTKAITATPTSFTPLTTTNGASNSAIAVGLGVGLGVGLPLVILVVVVCVVCARRRKASKTRNETKQENANDVSEHIDDKGYSMADLTLPGQRKSTHLTVVDNYVYSSAGYADVKQSSPSSVELRPQPDGGNNAQVYEDIRMSMINSKITETNGHVSKATSPPPVLPQDGDQLSVPESGVSLSDSQTDLTLVDSAIYGSNETGMQLQGEETGTATIVL